MSALISAYEECLKRLTELDILSPHENHKGLERRQVTEIITSFQNRLEPLDYERLKAEFFSDGPLSSLFEDEDITEIIIQGPNSIWYERKGELYSHEQSFLGAVTFQNFFHRVLDESAVVINQNHPCGDGRWRTFRLHVITPPLAEMESLTLRRQRVKPWGLKELVDFGWASASAVELLQSGIEQQLNILIIGATGSGKTSVCDALLREVRPNERCIVIEDSPEIKIPNSSSCRLLTRFDSQKILEDISATDLIRQSLRMRPHRLLLGEIRGPEAKDFLLALSTGHSGSLSTLHANDPRQALIRLEMLVQLGAPQWDLGSVRRLLSLSLNWVCTVAQENGKRILKSIDAIQGLESTGLLLENLYSSK